LREGHVRCVWLGVCGVVEGIHHLIWNGMKQKSTR
jgi:hypothetical protein